MGYLEMRCLRCGHEFDIGPEEIENNLSLVCPACGIVADKQNWGRIRAGFYLCQHLYGAAESVEIRRFQAKYKPGGE